MRQHAVLPRHHVRSVRKTSVPHLFRWVLDRYLLLPLGVLIGMIWANSAPASYFTFSYRLAFVVNEIGMAFFFALITQEMAEAMMPGGSLHSWRRWGLSIAASAGGVAGATLAYLACI